MISVHMLTKEEVADRLTKIGCQPSEETIDGCSCWGTRCGHYFLVPQIGPDGMTAEYILEEIIAEALAAAKPLH